MQRIRLTLRPQAAQAQPGEQLSFLLTIENSGSLAHDVAIRVIGLQRKAYTLNKPTVSIPPGDATRVHLWVKPPTDAAIGRYPFRVELTAEDDLAVRASATAELVVAKHTTRNLAWSVERDSPEKSRQTSGHVLSSASVTQDLTTTEEGEAPMAGHGQIDPAPFAPDRVSAQAPSWRRWGHTRPARPLVAVLGLVALLGLLGVATTRGLVNRAFSPSAPPRQPAVAPRPTFAAPLPSAVAAPTTHQRPQGEVKGIVAYATPVTATPRPAATATPFVITIGP